jgi:hypothetical protein
MQAKIIQSICGILRWREQHVWVDTTILPGRKVIEDESVEWHLTRWDRDARFRASQQRFAPALPTRWHDLKTDAPVWDDAAAGRKGYEIRRDDRDYQVGDGLRLRKTLHTAAEMGAGAPLIYTKDQPLAVVVTHVLRGAIYGVADGFAILSFQPLTARATCSAPAPAAIREAFLDFFADIDWDTEPPAQARVSATSVEALSRAVGFSSLSAVDAAADHPGRPMTTRRASGGAEAPRA